ncbi:MAG: hypothetical protein ACI9BK_003222 [Acidimicrobiales bacterium]|jgi:hypothetical protein
MLVAVEKWVQVHSCAVHIVVANDMGGRTLMI